MPDYPPIDNRRYPYPDWMRHYRGKYSQYWATRLGMIPNLATSFDNSFTIYELLAWLQRAFKVLADDFANLELEWEQYKLAIIELLKVLIPQLMREFMYSDEFRIRVFDLIWEWWYKYQEPRIAELERQIKLNWEDHQKIWDAINDINDALEDIRNQITLIWEEINKIWQRINQLEDIVLDAEFTPLVEGVDYTLQFFNGYFTSTDPIEVSVINSYDRWLVQIECNRLQNPDPVNNMVQSHNQSLDDEPKAAIFGITFLGDYADVNNAGLIEQTYTNADALFNIYPKSTDNRASWSPLLQVQRNYGGSSFVTVFRSLADGYNTQYSENYPNMPSDANLDYGVFSYKLTALKTT